MQRTQGEGMDDGDDEDGDEEEEEEEADESRRKVEALAAAIKSRKYVKCTECGREYPSRKALLKHQECHERDRPYKCRHCAFRGESLYRLEVHMHKHNSERFDCDECGKSFKWRANLTNHMKIHNGEGLLKCNICGRKCLSPSDLERHKDVHLTATPYSCDVCGKQFKHKQNLNQHSKLHTGRGLHKCTICHQACTSTSNLRKHMDTHSRKPKYECDVCQHKFKSSAQLRYHKRLHTRENIHICSFCGKCFPILSKLTMHMDAHTQSPKYRCQDCGKMYKHERALMRHRQVVHIGTNTYNCKICKKKFPSPSTLQYHMDSHVTTANYECEMCGEKFRRVRALRNHRKLHSGMGLQTCEHCGKTFFTPSALAAHLETHSDEEHPCSTCGRNFKHPKALERHQIEVHESTGSNQCPKCDRVYKSKAMLVQHMKIHSGKGLHSCSICKKKFIKLSELEKHSDVHSTENRYECSTCGKKYKHRYDLKVHAKLHTEKALKCEDCGKLFATKQQLNFHVVVHTNDTPHRCKICGGRFKYEYSLVKHWKLHLKGGRREAADQRKSKTNGDNSNRNEDSTTSNPARESPPSSRKNLAPIKVRGWKKYTSMIGQNGKDPSHKNGKVVSSAAAHRIKASTSKVGPGSCPQSNLSRTHVKDQLLGRDTRSKNGKEKESLRMTPFADKTDSRNFGGKKNESASCQIPKRASNILNNITNDANICSDTDLNIETSHDECHKVISSTSYHDLTSARDNEDPGEVIRDSPSVSHRMSELVGESLMLVTDAPENEKDLLLGRQGNASIDGESSDGESQCSLRQYKILRRRNSGSESEASVYASPRPAPIKEAYFPGQSSPSSGRVLRATGSFFNLEGIKRTFKRPSHSVDVTSNGGQFTGDSSHESVPSDSNAHGPTHTNVIHEALQRGKKLFSGPKPRDVSQHITRESSNNVHSLNISSELQYSGNSLADISISQISRERNKESINHHSLPPDPEEPLPPAEDGKQAECDSSSSVQLTSHSTMMGSQSQDQGCVYLFPTDEYGALEVCAASETSSCRNDCDVCAFYKPVWISPDVCKIVHRKDRELLLHVKPIEDVEPEDTMVVSGSEEDQRENLSTEHLLNAELPISKVSEVQYAKRLETPCSLDCTFDLPQRRLKSSKRTKDSLQNTIRSRKVGRFSNRPSPHLRIKLVDVGLTPASHDNDILVVKDNKTLHCLASDDIRRKDDDRTGKAQPITQVNEYQCSPTDDITEGNRRTKRIPPGFARKSTSLASCSKNIGLSNLNHASDQQNCFPILTAALEKRVAKKSTGKVFRSPGQYGKDSVASSRVTIDPAVGPSHNPINGVVGKNQVPELSSKEVPVLTNSAHVDPIATIIGTSDSMETSSNLPEVTSMTKVPKESKKNSVARKNTSSSKRSHEIVPIADSHNQEAMSEFTGAIINHVFEGKAGENARRSDERDSPKDRHAKKSPRRRAVAVKSLGKPHRRKNVARTGANNYVRYGRLIPVEEVQSTPRTSHFRRNSKQECNNQSNIDETGDLDRVLCDNLDNLGESENPKQQMTSAKHSVLTKSVHTTTPDGHNDNISGHPNVSGILHTWSENQSAVIDGSSPEKVSDVARADIGAEETTEELDTSFDPKSSCENNRLPLTITFTPSDGEHTREISLSNADVKQHAEHSLVSSRDNNGTDQSKEVRYSSHATAPSMVIVRNIIGTISSPQHSHDSDDVINVVFPTPEGSSRIQSHTDITQDADVHLHHATQSYQDEVPVSEHLDPSPSPSNTELVAVKKSSLAGITVPATTSWRARYVRECLIILSPGDKSPGRTPNHPSLSPASLDPGIGTLASDTSADLNPKPTSSPLTPVRTVDPVGNCSSALNKTSSPITRASRSKSSRVLRPVREPPAIHTMEQPNNTRNDHNRKQTAKKATIQSTTQPNIDREISQGKTPQWTDGTCRSNNTDKRNTANKQDFRGGVPQDTPIEPGSSSTLASYQNTDLGQNFIQRVLANVDTALTSQQRDPSSVRIASSDADIHSPRSQIVTGRFSKRQRGGFISSGKPNYLRKAIGRVKVGSPHARPAIVRGRKAMVGGNNEDVDTEMLQVMKSRRVSSRRKGSRTNRYPIRANRGVINRFSGLDPQASTGQDISTPATSSSTSSTPMTQETSRRTRASAKRDSSVESTCEPLDLSFHHTTSPERIATYTPNIPPPVIVLENAEEGTELPVVTSVQYIHPRDINDDCNHLSNFSMSITHVQSMAGDSGSSSINDNSGGIVYSTGHVKQDPYIPEIITNGVPMSNANDDAVSVPSDSVVFIPIKTEPHVEENLSSQPPRAICNGSIMQPTPVEVPGFIQVPVGFKIVGIMAVPDTSNQLYPSQLGLE